MPLFVDEAISPPLNCPFATSYVLVNTRVSRIASRGTVPAAYVRPSSEMWFCVARCPATEKLAVVVSVADVLTTPGVSAAIAARSPALSRGSRLRRS